ncbi:hypothetical protein [Staphylococcus lugdunensis]|nr:hypothetical protein [Staphylococcus lugdunensis]
MNLNLIELSYDFYVNYTKVMIYFKDSSGSIMIMIDKLLNFDYKIDDK